MHIPDGFIDGSTSVVAGAVAIGALGLSLHKAGDIVEDGRAPMAGLVAAFVFAGQMVNFPVASGTSGHLLGGVLAAILLGPWLGSIVVAVVVSVQSLLFADGGLSALGLNVINMAIVPAFAGYAVFFVIRKVLPATRPSVVGAAAATAWLSVVLASVAFAVEYLVGGNGAASLATVATAMIGVHAVIGVGEAVITGLVVAALLSVRPDLVYGARDLVVPDPVQAPVGVA